MAQLNEKQSQTVFGLDIGTRSIVGTVGYLEGNKFHVIAQHSKEHETRAMLDGQIHDIQKVGESIIQVKEVLEKELGRKLTEVCIAAAGRVLRTVTTFVETSFENEKEVTEDDVYMLSTLGVEKAYVEFQKGNDTEMKFYCVGYTPMRYYLNGYQISNLVGHKAKTIGLDLIGTFLPDDVVDGLYKAVEIAGLRVANLTLEPIAAIQVAIPEKFRMLNMALVDVGAGTSDICITKEGTITAYGMIPQAGDSLTDIIVQHCLCEFDVAEKIKRSAGVQDTIEYEDIMGLPQTISSAEVEGILEDTVEQMTLQVAEGIKNLNGEKPVSAVFVVGGGGMIPGYTQKLAKHLGILPERVAIRGKEVMQNIIFDIENPRRDAMMVTPIGICYSFYEQSNNFIFAEFNGERIKLYDTGKLTVADCAMQISFPNEELFPRRGKALTFTVNEKSRMVRGQLGEASTILVNGAEAYITTQIKNGDKIEVTSSTIGEPAELELGKLPEFSEKMVITVNGMPISLPKTAFVNGVLQNEYYTVKEGDVIDIHNYYTVEEIGTLLDMAVGSEIKVNDIPAKRDTRVYEDFTLTFSADVEEELDGVLDEEETTQDIEQHIPQEVNQEELQVTKTSENNEKSIQQKEEVETGKTEEEVDFEPVAEPVTVAVIVNKKPIVMSGKPSYVFVDVFDYIQFDLHHPPKGKGIVTNMNGHPAEYMATLQDGDIIDIYWE